MGLLGIYAVVVAALGLPPALFATARERDSGCVLRVLLMGILGAAVLVAGAYALLFDGYVEDQGMQPARTLPIAIPLLALGTGVSIAAWWKAARR